MFELKAFKQLSIAPGKELCAPVPSSPGPAAAHFGLETLSPGSGRIGHFLFLKTGDELPLGEMRAAEESTVLSGSTST